MTAEEFQKYRESFIPIPKCLEKRPRTAPRESMTPSSLLIVFR